MDEATTTRAMQHGIIAGEASCTTGKARPYSDNQAEDMVHEDAFMRAFDDWTEAFATFVAPKGRIPPGRWRAYGYEAPGHKWADMKLKWREIRMGLGRAPTGSSPAEQERLQLNDDATLHPERGEGERLRKE